MVKQHAVIVYNYKSSQKNMTYNFSSRVAPLLLMICPMDANFYHDKVDSPWKQFSGRSGFRQSKGSFFITKFQKCRGYRPSCREMEIIDVLAEAGRCKHIFKGVFQ